jgi:hypothetical protein
VQRRRQPLGAAWLPAFGLHGQGNLHRLCERDVDRAALLSRLVHLSPPPPGCRGRGYGCRRRTLFRSGATPPMPSSPRESALHSAVASMDARPAAALRALSRRCQARHGRPRGLARPGSSCVIGRVSVPTPRSRKARTRSLQIEHVVVVMMENRSFDNYLGVLGRRDGFTVGSEGKPTNTCSAVDGKPLRCSTWPAPPSCPSRRAKPGTRPTSSGTVGRRTALSARTQVAARMVALVVDGVDAVDVDRGQLDVARTRPWRCPVSGLRLLPFRRAQPCAPLLPSAPPAIVTSPGSENSPTAVRPAGTAAPRRSAGAGARPPPQPACRAAEPGHQRRLRGSPTSCTPGTRQHGQQERPVQSPHPQASNHCGWRRFQRYRPSAHSTVQTNSSSSASSGSVSVSSLSPPPRPNR